MFDTFKQKLMSKAMGLDEAQLRERAEQLQTRVGQRMVSDFGHLYDDEAIIHLVQRFFYHQAMVGQELMRDPESLPPP